MTPSNAVDFEDRKSVLYDKATELATWNTLLLLFSEGAYKATKFLSPKLVVTASRRWAKQKIDKRDKRAEVLLKIGRPNFQEREQICQLVKAGEPFPVSKILLKFPKDSKMTKKSKKRGC